MNNTSVILAFNVKGHVLLFPGDAQIENWRYALSKKSARAWLAKTRFYKVGHHGSLNATPKSLWNLFEHRADGAVKAMQSVNSTMGGKYGKEFNQTEVPRRPLVDALEASTRYFTTQTIKGKKLSRAFEVDLTTTGWNMQDVD
jgi:hypothetical protein